MPKLSKAGLEFINDNPPLLSFLYDINALPECAWKPETERKMLIAVISFALGAGYRHPELLMEEKVCVD